MENRCELCNRKNIKTTNHHLIPKEKGGTFLPTANLCISCHKQIHALFTNEQLADELNTIEKLKNNEKMLGFIKWIRKQPSSTLPQIKKSNALKKRKR
jgi:5-methylcytosine-specific restriction enzyme A